MDYAPQADRIVVEQTQEVFLQFTIVQVGADTEIAFQGNVLVLKGTSAAAITAANFDFIGTAPWDGLATSFFQGWDFLP